MGKKFNAYSLFVEDEFRKRIRRNEKVIKAQLYSGLNEKWKDIPEYVKAQYKLYAKMDNPFPLRIDYKEEIKSENMINDSGFLSQNPLDIKPITSKSADLSLDVGPTNSSQLVNFPSIQSNLDLLPEPTLQLTRGEKRAHCDDYDDGPNGSQTAYELTEHDSRYKKHKPGIPKFHKDKDDSKIEILRYKDYHLYQSRVKCEKLIESRADCLLDIPIHAFSVNVLCNGDKGLFLPLELTIYSYSIKDGQTIQPLHIFIDPGHIPLGRMNFAMDHAGKHKIKYLFNTEHRQSYVRSDYKRIYKDIIKYTQEGERILLIMNESELEQTKGCLQWLYTKATEDGTNLHNFRPETFSIYLVVDFVAAMHNYIRQKVQKMHGPELGLHYKLRTMLERGTLEHHPELVCDYHKKPDKETAWCTRSCAIRTISNLSDFLEQTYQLYNRPLPPSLPTAEPHHEPPMVDYLEIKYVE